MLIIKDDYIDESSENQISNAKANSNSLSDNPNNLITTELTSLTKEEIENN